ncbi:hypothetical protein PF005_g1977 [Phytophthora fragariae]|uniref:Uncharacterized protein n=1 Tax=Phytophthora fragariae TaxID=53985 RepID=A0A6A3UQG0_9STRA|nr:hypothetical protein PF009_g1877 [Phytophthora fragariae]KAE9136374.1 hypothetical protein PF010_g1711 [Phytophthora fragariae]KAE9138159.1 hypothetical protein PF007_g1525 [Phytophthora fragariae]KAE9153818.1 hypothetical protein PF006_g2079 [Phytophthora fragariae]KAE9234249.1 hypothetical protein PF005_g1977 [Phytophthora fragariae]
MTLFATVVAFGCGKRCLGSKRCTAVVSTATYGVVELLHLASIPTVPFRLSR